MLVAAEVVIANCWLTLLATLLAVVLSIQVANVMLTTVVADKSKARNQSPEAVAKMALASDVVVVVQVSRQLPKPRGRSPSTDPRKVAQYLTRERQQQSAKETQQQSQLGKFMNPVLFDICRCKPCLQRSRITLVTRREPSSRRLPQGNAAPTTSLRCH